MPDKKETHPESLNIIAELARIEALKHDGHVPTLLVTGTEKGMVGQLPELPDTHEGRAQILFNAGYTLAQEGNIGVPIQVFLISEAWLSLPKDGKLKVRPSEDPNRIEILLIAGLHILQQMHGFVALEMLRDETEKLIELREHSRHVGEGRGYSPLLEAFVLGYHAGLSAEDNPNVLPS